MESETSFTEPEADGLEAVHAIAGSETVERRFVVTRMKHGSNVRKERVSLLRVVERVIEPQ